MPEKTDFATILRPLAEHEVKVIVVAGIGGAPQGAPITTFDLDVLHSTDPSNIARLLTALDSMEAYYRAQPELKLKPSASHLASSGHQLLMTRFGPLDLLGIIGHGHTYADLGHRAIPMSTGPSCRSCAAPSRKKIGDASPNFLSPATPTPSLISRSARPSLRVSIPTGASISMSSNSVVSIRHQANARKTDLAILRVFAAHEVKFIVVGGIGAVLQGAPITTLDLDVVHSTDPANVARLLTALDSLEAYYRMQPERKLRPLASHPASPGHQWLMTRFGPLNLLGIIRHGHTYDDLLHRAIPMSIDATPSVMVLELGALIEETAAERPSRLAILRRALEEKDQ